MFRSLFNVLVFVAFTIALLVGLFIAWWIAVCAVLGIVTWFGVRRLFGAGPAVAAAAASPVVIEGQYRVEPEAQGRIIELAGAHLEDPLHPSR